MKRNGLTESETLLLLVQRVIPYVATSVAVLVKNEIRTKRVTISMQVAQHAPRVSSAGTSTIHAVACRHTCHMHNMYMCMYMCMHMYMCTPLNVRSDLLAPDRTRTERWTIDIIDKAGNSPGGFQPSLPARSDFLLTSYARRPLLKVLLYFASTDNRQK